MTLKQIKIHDKSFSSFIDEDLILARIKSLAEKLEEDFKEKDLFFVVILNGAFMFASDLMKNIKSNVEISFVKVSSYKGTQTSGRVDELIGLNSSLENKNVVVLEDIVDTGITIDKVISLIRANDPLSVDVCTLLYKPEAHKGKFKPKYVGFEIPDKFVVGYGLDYNEQGRNLKELYQLK